MSSAADADSDSDAHREASRCAFLHRLLPLSPSALFVASQTDVDGRLPYRVRCNGMRIRSLLAYFEQTVAFHKRNRNLHQPPSSPSKNETCAACFAPTATDRPSNLPSLQPRCVTTPTGHWVPNRRRSLHPRCNGRHNASTFPRLDSNGGNLDAAGRRDAPPRGEPSR